MISRNLLYHKGIDHAPATYLTNYLITITIFSLVYLFYHKKRFVLSFKINKINGGINQLFCYSLLLTSLSFLCGGFVHQFWAHDDEYPNTPLGWHIFWRLALIFNVISRFIFIPILHLSYYIKDNNDISMVSLNTLQLKEEEELIVKTKKIYFWAIIYSIIALICIIVFGVFPNIDYSAYFDVIVFLIVIIGLVVIMVIHKQWSTWKILLIVYCICYSLSFFVYSICDDNDNGISTYSKNCFLTKDYNENFIFHLVIIPCIMIACVAVWKVKIEFELIKS